MMISFNTSSASGLICAFTTTGTVNRANNKYLFFIFLFVLIKTMNSPVEDIVLQSVSIDKNDKTAVYLQIAQHLIRAIQNKTLDEGTALPGTRSLSRLLKIHRNTAVAVYDELASQGWVAIVAN